MTSAPTTTGLAPALRRLYLVRFAFALVWAGSLFATASGIGPVSAALLVLYPVFDVAAAVVDARSSRAWKPTASTAAARNLYLNIAISSLAAIGLAVAVTSGVPAVLRVWGIWAVASGIVQLVVGLGRRGLGGQWAMIASGALSTLAGTTFFLQASGEGAALGTLAGYALVGGIFFLVSALRLGRTPGEG